MLKVNTHLTFFQSCRCVEADGEQTLEETPRDIYTAVSRTHYLCMFRILTRCYKIEEKHTHTQITILSLTG